MSNLLTKTELEIMEYLWSINCETTAREIRNHFSNRNWSKQAMSTFLKHLSQYGYIHIRKESFTKYYYSPAITAEEYNLMPAKNIIKDHYNGSYSNFILALFDSKPISAEEMASLKERLSELE